MNINKIKLIILILLPFLISACSKEQTNQTNQTSESKEIFFECEMEGRLGIEKANIAYNPETATVSLESNYMGRGMENFKVVDLRVTGTELIIVHSVYGLSYNPDFRLNRESLELIGPGNRKGKCKIIKKELAF